MASPRQPWSMLYMAREQTHPSNPSIQLHQHRDKVEAVEHQARRDEGKPFSHRPSNGCAFTGSLRATTLSYVVPELCEHLTCSCLVQPVDYAYCHLISCSPCTFTNNAAQHSLRTCLDCIARHKCNCNSQHAPGRFLRHTKGVADNHTLQGST